MIVNKKICASVQVSHEECEDDINCEESIDNIVQYRHRPPWSIKKPELKRRRPSCVDNQNNQKRFPNPVMSIQA